MADPTSFTFRIVFRGLCLFVPDSLAMPTAYTVVLPEAKPTNTIQPYIQECSSHFASLGFPLESVAAQGCPDGIQGWINLDNIDVELGLHPADGSSTGGVSATLDYVPNIDLLEPRNKGVNPTRVQLGLQDPTVAARIRLAAGTLSTRDIFEIDGSPIQVAFVPAPPIATPQLLAKTIVFETPNLTGPVTINLHDLAKGTKACLVLNSVAGKDIEIKIANVCGDRLVEDLGATLDLPAQDEDFAWYYMLGNVRRGQAPAPGIRPTPVPIPVPTDYKLIGQEGGEPVRCGPAQSNPAAPLPAGA